MTVSLGTWALSHPPFEQVVGQAVQAEQAGFDWITFWDQMNWMAAAA